jgi:cytosine permease
LTEHAGPYPSSSPPISPVPDPAVSERLPWQTSTAPRYIGLFLWIVFFDQLGRRTLAVGGLLPSVLGAIAAGLLCYLLLYYVPAMWGFRTGQPLTTLGTSTFGEAGTGWLTGVLVGLAQVVWFAVATSYATDLTFRGLVSCGLLDPRALEPLVLGRLKLPSLLFLVTAATWTYAAALVGHYLPQIIAALMNVYPVFMAVLLAVTMLATIRGVPQFRPPGIDQVTGASVAVREGVLRAVTMMIELVCGFFATAGALSADWGAANRTDRDVRMGGLVGVSMSVWTVAALALLSVAGSYGHDPGPAGLVARPGPPAGTLAYTFRNAVLLGIGGKLGGTILLVFGLGSLAPACYTAYLFGRRFEDAWPRIARLRWTLLGTTAASLLIALGVADRLDTTFSLMGAIFAPLVAAVAAEYVRHRGTWPGPRRGVNAPGLAAWAVGLAVGLVPVAAEAVGMSDRPAARFQPAVMFAFLTAFVTYQALAALRLEAPPASDSGTATDT